MTSAMAGSRKKLDWPVTQASALVHHGCFVGCTDSAQEATSFRAVIPKVCDEAALEEWVTPVATLNVRPKHISTQEYYSAREHNL